MADVHSKEIRSKNTCPVFRDGSHQSQEHQARNAVASLRHEVTTPSFIDYPSAFAARKQGKTRGAMVFSLNFLVTFSFKRKSDK